MITCFQKRRMILIVVCFKSIFCIKARLFKEWILLRSDFFYLVVLNFDILVVWTESFYPSTCFCWFFLIILDIVRSWSCLKFNLRCSLSPKIWNMRISLLFTCCFLRWKLINFIALTDKLMVRLGQWSTYLFNSISFLFWSILGCLCLFIFFGSTFS